MKRRGVAVILMAAMGKPRVILLPNRSVFDRVFFTRRVPKRSSSVPGDNPLSLNRVDFRLLSVFLPAGCLHFVRDCVNTR